MLYRLRELLNEDANSTFLDDRTSYSLLYEAAKYFVDITGCLKATQSITTVADQQTYTINADFLRLYLKNSRNDYFLEYSDGTSTYTLYWKDYEDIIFENNTTSVTIPSHFAIIDKPTLNSRLTGTVTATSAASGGESTLTDSSADFSNVSPGDNVHNTTDGSSGIVLSADSSTSLTVALFGGTNNDWTSGDSYVIQPQGRLQLVLSPPPSQAGHAITLRYVQKPDPVFSDYGIYRFPEEYHEALCYYAAWFYKYRDREPNFGDRLYQQFDFAVRKASDSLKRTFRKSGLRVNLRKRN